jgi:hypothetical protein
LCLEAQERPRSLNAGPLLLLLLLLHHLVGLVGQYALCQALAGRMLIPACLPGASA